LLHVADNPYGISGAGQMVLDKLRNAFADRMAPGREARTMPMSMLPQADGSLMRVGPAAVFAPLGGAADPHTIVLKNLLCREILHGKGKASGARFQHLWDRASVEVNADVVIVCADALRTPQVLFASGIRPPALGCFLNEHAFLTGRAIADFPKWGLTLADLPLERPGEGVCGSYWVPHSDAAQPTHGSLMDRVVRDERGRPFAYQVGLSWYVPLETKRENRIEFSDTQPDATGMPRMRVVFQRSEADHRAIEAGRDIQVEVGQTLGKCSREVDTTVLGAGSSLHFTGTVRMGSTDDGQSVCDNECRVWGFDNLYVAGCGVVPTELAVNSTLSGAISAVIAARAALAAIGQPSIKTAINQ
jgi:choline dehydrogenase-like flavoprotein